MKLKKKRFKVELFNWIYMAHFLSMLIYQQGSDNIKWDIFIVSSPLACFGLFLHYNISDKQLNISSHFMLNVTENIAIHL